MSMRTSGAAKVMVEREGDVVGACQAERLSDTKGVAGDAGGREKWSAQGATDEFQRCYGRQMTGEKHTRDKTRDRHTHAVGTA